MSGFKTEALVSFMQDLERAEKMLGSSKVSDLVKDAMQPVEEAARRNVKKRSGKVAGSIMTHVKAERGGRFKATTGNHRKDWPGGPEDKNYYPAPLEYGHAGPKGSSRRTPPHPYLRPAWDSHKEEALQNLMVGIAQLLKDSGL